MTATAEILRDLHLLHQRAKALRDRLSSAPGRWPAARQPWPTARPRSKKPVRLFRMPRCISRRTNTSLQAQQTKIDDLKAKLNQVKKNEEYKALQNQIAHDKAAMSKTEDEILQNYEEVETQGAAVAKLEAEVKSFAQDVAALHAEIESQASSHKAQLEELEKAIIEAEVSIPEDGPGTLQPYCPAVWCRCAWLLARTAPAWAVSRQSPPRCSTT